jgi:hypothetical protein
MSDNAIRSALLNMGVDIGEINAVMPAATSSQPSIVGGQSIKETIMQTVGTAGAQPATPSSGAPATSAVFGNQQPASVAAVSSAPDDEFIRKWSWGGFFLFIVYLFASRLYKKAVLYLLGTAVPILDIVLWIKTGLRGRKMTWESGKWTDFEAYKKRQKLLDKIGIILFTISILATIVFVALGAMGVLTWDLYTWQH